MVTRLDALIDAFSTIGDANPIPAGIEVRPDDEQYKGYTIYPAANSQFAVGMKGIIQKSKFPSVEAAKKWIDDK